MVFYGFGVRKSAFFCLKMHYAKDKRKPRKPLFSSFRGSEPGGIRTHDLLIRSQSVSCHLTVTPQAFQRFDRIKTIVFLWFQSASGGSVC